MKGFREIRTEDKDLMRVQDSLRTQFKDLSNDIEELKNRKLIWDISGLNGLSNGWNFGLLSFNLPAGNYIVELSLAFLYVTNSTTTRAGGAFQLSSNNNSTSFSIGELPGSGSEQPVIEITNNNQWRSIINSKGTLKEWRGGTVFLHIFTDIDAGTASSRILGSSTATFERIQI